MSSVTIQTHKVICKQPDNYLGWPTIGRLSDGKILVVFSGDRETHHCPYGKNQLIRSVDNGETWSPAQTINNTPLDDRDTGITVLRSGTIVVSWMTDKTWELLAEFAGFVPEETLTAWRRHCDKITPNLRRQWLGCWTRRSTDGGVSWEPAVPSVAQTPHGPIQLRNGLLLFVGVSKAAGRALVCASSTDEAKSWTQIGTFSVPDEFAKDLPFGEPHAVELPDERIVCMWRHTPRDRPKSTFFLHQCESSDGGRTWSMLRPTPIWGFPPHLIRLHSGALLVTYGYRREPFGQRACMSHDGGRTWDLENEIILRDDAPSGDLGYPATLELTPGEFLTVYYQIDPPDTKTSLFATRWSFEG